jgi:hypothetical protein
VLNPSGEVAVQPLRTPFGALIEQPLKGDPVWIPAGFQGGIEDPESGVVILEGDKPYDSILGQWMVPRVERILDPGFEDPDTVQLYRFSNNDPLNPEQLTRGFSYMNSLDDWLNAFGIDPPSAYLKNLDLPDSVKLFGRTEIEARFSLSGQSRNRFDDAPFRPKIFSDKCLPL